MEEAQASGDDDLRLPLLRFAEASGMAFQRLGIPSCSEPNAAAPSTACRDDGGGGGGGGGGEAASGACGQGATLLQTIANVINIFVGIGLLSMPYAVMRGGWMALGFLAALVSLFATSGQARGNASPPPAPAACDAFASHCTCTASSNPWYWSATLCPPVLLTCS
jgi:hypothetical protein